MEGYAFLCIYASGRNARYSAMQGVSPELGVRETRSGSGARGHVGREDVVGVTVQVLTGPVVAHGGARVGVPGGDLDVPEVDASIEHGRHESVTEHMRVCPGDPDAGGLG